MDTAKPMGSGALPLASVNPMDERLAGRRRLIAHTVMVLSGVQACDAGRPLTAAGAERPAARAFRRVVEGVLQRDGAHPAGSGVASGEGGDS